MAREHRLKTAATILRNLVTSTPTNGVRVAKFVNLLTPRDKAKYVDVAWDMLQAAYSDIGGFKSSASKEDLVHDSYLWKLNTRKGKVVALCVYKKQYGRKMIGLATDGSSEGKSALLEILKEDLTRAWLECSGAVERMLMKLGGDKYIVPAQYASKLTGKQVIPSEDGIHYTRKIGGDMYEKVIIGTPEGMEIDRTAVQAE